MLRLFCGLELAGWYTIRIYKSTFRTSLKFRTASGSAESVLPTTYAHPEQSCIRLIIFAFGVCRKFRGDRAKNSKARIFRCFFFSGRFISTFSAFALDDKGISCLFRRLRYLRHVRANAWPAATDKLLFIRIFRVGCIGFFCILMIGLLRVF